MSWTHSTMAIYLNYAATETSDPVERIKCIIAQTTSQKYYDFILEKPLNPVLGETVQVTGQDGAKIFLEQTSHHPPRSHMLIEGPDGNYTVNGFCTLNVKAGFEKAPFANILIDGHTTYKFKDGQTVKCSLTNFRLWNIMTGNLSWQTVGEWTLEDKANDLTAVVKMNTEKDKPQDFFSGEICKGGQKVCSIYGNYMGFVDFDGVRYWDLRDEEHQPKHFRPIWIDKDRLRSDSTLRMDRMYLCMPDYDAG